MISHLSYRLTPLQEITSMALDKAGVSLYVKREDLNHELVTGNKWWKLKCNLAEALRLGHRRIVTFGGAYSNHLYATAAAANSLGLKSVGIVRGEKPSLPSPTLRFMEAMGMELHFVSREDYRRKDAAGWLEEMHIDPGEHYLIPEGGTNHLAIEGVKEWGRTLCEYDFDFWCVSVGTGGTMAGLVAASDKATVFGFSSLKDGSFLSTRVTELLTGTGNAAHVPWRIHTNYHFGGYAKTNEVLREFLQEQAVHGLPLDPVYTGKMFYGVTDMILRGEFPRGTRVCALHTGGLQGAAPK